MALQGLARSKRIKKTKPDDLQECLQKAVYRLMFPGVSRAGLSMCS